MDSNRFLRPMKTVQKTEKIPKSLNQLNTMEMNYKRLKSALKCCKSPKWLKKVHELENSTKGWRSPERLKTFQEVENSPRG